ncbi:MAG: hypothetical protein CMP00_04420 [Woeseiaceae bacterium]|jgi:hypothetical protein|nr:hypothetical protein [Woeseiaceae bacterium]|tara:strand:+ start:1142 stop:2272 length:1131 start_codon:yes stop_codon:yes gene_type:complete
MNHIISKTELSKFLKTISQFIFKFISIYLVTISPLMAKTSVEGKWMLILNGGKGQIDNSVVIGAPTDNKAAIIGELSLSQINEKWMGHVEGGPVDVKIDDNVIEIVVDSRDLAGFVFFRRLKGNFSTKEMSGTFTIEGTTETPEAGGKWIAIRKDPNNELLPPKPVDISGLWTPAPGVDFRKYSMDLTEKAKLWHKDYIDHYDQPNVRCVSPGIVAISAWGAYPFEILKSEERLTFLYEVDSEVRRIYMNKKEPPAYYPTSGMGFSNGYWNGSDLVIETQLLEGNVRDFRGEPISDGARMHERYSLSEDGQTLSAVITLLDPANYEQPPIRRRKWTRNSSTEIYPYECDPDSFYRQMYDENKLEMYFERSHRRQID